MSKKNPNPLPKGEGDREATRLKGAAKRNPLAVAKKKAEVSLVRSSAAEYLTFVAAGRRLGSQRGNALRG
jgi:hypothetical protein